MVIYDCWFFDEVVIIIWEVYDGIVEFFEGGYVVYVL